MKKLMLGMLMMMSQQISMAQLSLKGVVSEKESEAPFLKEYLYALKQYNDAHPRRDSYYYDYPRYHFFYNPFFDPFWGGRYYNRHPHFRGFVRGGW